MENEIWKDIKDYEGLYRVSNKGNIKSLDRQIIDKNGTTKQLKGRIMSQALQKENLTGNFYKIVLLSKNGMSKRSLVHRLVAEVFVPNPNNKKLVNHIDGDKGNNNDINLEWVTDSENKLHSMRTLKTKTILVINIETNNSFMFSNLSEAFEVIDVEKRYHRKIQYHFNKRNKYAFDKYIFKRVKQY